MTRPSFRAVRWAPDGALRIIDQRRLPGEFVECDLRSVADVADAIRTLAVRGAPAIGVAAAMGVVAAMDAERDAGHLADAGALRRFVYDAAAALQSTRPTAVNLAWALDRMRAVLDGEDSDPQALARALRDAAERIRAEDEAMCDALGRHGATLLKDGTRVLTHCNAGALATAGIGTALAPVYEAHAAGRRIEVFADETRPLLQGARITAWELTRAGVPVTVVADGTAASLMAAGRVDIVLVGADRIAANGDTANKIGTYALAVLARHHKIPFVVVAPSSTIDAQAPGGESIPIEQRDPDEMTHLGTRRVAAEGAAVYNPAFDVTPAALVTHIVTEDGVLCAPYHFDRATLSLPPA